MQKINCKYIFSEQEVAKIINWYKVPQSLSWMAKQFGLKNRSVIKRVLIENNVILRNKDEIGKLSSRNCRQTCLNKYGVENVFQLEEVKQKARQTKFETYGDEEYHNQAKIKQTCMKKYGTTNGG